MEYKDVAKKRRAVRSLKKTPIDKELIKKIYETVKLTPSCYNKQPWRFIFIYEDNQLERICESLSKGNSWAKEASLIIAVVSSRELDCVLNDGREYYKLDTGMAMFNMILTLTDMGYIAHPIAGYDLQRARDVFNVQDPFEVLALIIVGKESDDYTADDQTRKPLEEVFFINRFD